MQQGPGRGESQGPSFDAFAHQGRHLGDLAGVGLVVGVAAVAEHVGANRRMRHVGADIDRTRLSLQGVEVFRETLPLPVDAFGQGRARDVLDPFHQFDEEVVRVRPHRRKADATVAHDRGRHAMPAGRREQGIPRRLAIVVGVNVHPAGCHGHAGGVDLAAALAGHLADLDDAIAVDGDITHEGLSARPVDNGPAPDDQVAHAVSSQTECFWPRLCALPQRKHQTFRCTA